MSLSLSLYTYIYLSIYISYWFCFSGEPCLIYTLYSRVWLENGSLISIITSSHRGLALIRDYLKGIHSFLRLYWVLAAARVVFLAAVCGV